MNRRAFRWKKGGFAFATLICLMCACTRPPEMRGRYLPEPGVAIDAVRQSLKAWTESPQIERTTTTPREIMFVEQQQPPNQRLRAFEILGETPGAENEGYRRILARLTLEGPDDVVVAAYYVFGQGPIWVYRAEDFEMIMHMDKSMMPPPPPMNRPASPDADRKSPATEGRPPEKSDAGKPGGSGPKQ